MQANPSESKIYVERDITQHSNLGRIGYPVKHEVHYTTPERQQKRLENLHP